MNDYTKSMIIMYGYIRQCWSLKEFDGMAFPSQDIINLMSKWYANEMIYFIQWIENSLWRISLDKILS